MEFIVFFLLFSLFNNIYSTEATDVKKLFVFGDSLVDVGNYQKEDVGSWSEPYGETFPGTPSGRFSDGRVLSDYIATFLGLEAPVAFNLMKSAEKSKLQNGMNFACGGSGIKGTPKLNPKKAPTMAKQIDNLQQLLETDKFYTKDDLQLSLAFINIGVNDYMEYEFENRTDLRVAEYTALLINQLVDDIKRIQNLGVLKIAVATVMPLGCAPSKTAPDHKTCSEADNKKVELHNQKLKEAVQKLNNVEIVDVYQAMMSVLNRPQGSLNFNPLKQCCGGVSPKDDICGLEKNGKKMYEKCENPKLSVFWDFVHPSQNGWELIYSALKSSLKVLFT